jgi:hypothetical protein
LGIAVASHADDALRREPTTDWLLAVVAEALPGEQWSPTLDELRRRRPTLPIVRLVGPGCDGELRSSPPAAAHRCHWLDAPADFARDCDLLDRGACPSWGRPITVGPEEIRPTDIDDDTPSASAGRQVAVVTHEPAMAAWLIDAVRSWDAHVTRLDETRFDEQIDPTHAADVVLWHVPDGDERAAAELRRLRNRFPTAGIVALVSFPRVEQVRRLRNAGVCAVSALPASTGMLERTVAAVAASS